MASSRNADRQQRKAEGLQGVPDGTACNCDTCASGGLANTLLPVSERMSWLFNGE